MKRIFGTAVFWLLALSHAFSAAGSSARHAIVPVIHEKPADKKKAAIRLYPNPSTNGRVCVVSNIPGVLNFYIFDLDGTLLHQATIHQNEKHTITDLKKGVYTYDAFYNDEGIEHGKLIVK